MFSRVFLSAVLVMSGPVSAVAAEGDKWRPYVDVEGKLGTDRNLGEVGLFVPLGQSQDSLLFGNLITRFDDQDSFEGNIGLGYREIVDGNYILGGYAFFDRRKSASDNYFNQITAGAEFMTDVWTARGNVYFADNDLAPTGGGVVTQTGTQIFVQSNMEGALSGFDAEVGRVIPLGLEDVTLTGFAGGFHFGRSGFEEVSGPRGRAELSFNNLWDTVLPSGTQLRFGAEVQHDDVRDTQGFFSARLRVPLFGGSSSSNLSVLEQRMVDPVVRDIDVVAGGTLSAPVAPVLESNGTTLNNANFVDADDDLGVALAAAGENALVVIDGSKGVITSAADADALTGQTIVGAQGAGLSLLDPNTGQTIMWRPNGVRPTLSDLRLTLPGSNTVQGLDVDNGYVTAGGFFFLGAPVPSDIVVSDVAFSGSYSSSVLGTVGILSVTGVQNVTLSNLSFADLDFAWNRTGLGFNDIRAISLFAATDVTISNVSANNVAVNSNTKLITFSLLGMDLSNNVMASNIHVDGLSAATTGAGAAARLSGILARSSTATIQNSSIRNLTSTAANGDANTTGVSLVGTSLALDTVVINGLAETGTNVSSTTGVADLSNGLFVGGVSAPSLTMNSVNIAGATRSLEFGQVLPPLILIPPIATVPVTLLLDGSGNTLDAGVAGCVNNIPGTLTITGTISFTNGSSCP
ncbi:MAG: hypothetical protein HEP70_07860 [Rhodobiaceae bacterium]|nr:hypothetical protein [Rhodobiaceae bacterium]